MVLRMLRKGFCNKFTPRERRDKVLPLGGAGAALRGGSPDLSAHADALPGDTGNLRRLRNLGYLDVLAPGDLPIRLRLVGFGLPDLLGADFFSLGAVVQDQPGGCIFIV